jgi:glutathione reductase (NADPH)
MMSKSQSAETQVGAEGGKSMTRKFDVVSLGTGSGASAVAYQCRAAGWQVAIVDSRPFGGTCALRGCDPKKVLVGAAEVVDWARRMKGSGIRAEQLEIGWPELMRFKRTFTGPVPRNREKAFVKAGIATFHGRARFVGPSTVQVGEEVLEGRYAVIAAGQKPTDLKIPGAEHLTTSEEFLELDELPGRILFIGGGYIGFELPMWRRVLDRKSRLCIVVHAPFHDSIPIWSMKS